MQKNGKANLSATSEKFLTGIVRTSKFRCLSFRLLHKCPEHNEDFLHRVNNMDNTNKASLTSSPSKHTLVATTILAKSAVISDYYRAGINNIGMACIIGVLLTGKACYIGGNDTSKAFLSSLVRHH
jgi:hypothetical protein